MAFSLITRILPISPLALLDLTKKDHSSKRLPPASINPPLPIHLSELPRIELPKIDFSKRESLYLKYMNEQLKRMPETIPQFKFRSTSPEFNIQNDTLFQYVRPDYSWRANLDYLNTRAINNLTLPKSNWELSLPSVQPFQHNVVPPTLKKDLCIPLTSDQGLTLPSLRTCRNLAAGILLLSLIPIIQHERSLQQKIAATTNQAIAIDLIRSKNQYKLISIACMITLLTLAVFSGPLSLPLSLGTCAFGAVFVAHSFYSISKNQELIQDLKTGRITSRNLVVW